MPAASSLDQSQGDRHPPRRRIIPVHKSAAVALRPLEGLGEGVAEVRGPPSPGLVALQETTLTRISLRPRNLRVRRLQKTLKLHGTLAERQGARLRCQPWVVLLTYKPSVGWVAGQVAEYVRCVQRDAVRKGGVPWAYERVVELHKSGRVHLHFCWWVPKRLKMPHADRRGWWPHGITTTEPARKGVAYLLKYFSKGTEGSHRVPTGARLFSCGGLNVSARIAMAWQLLPEYVREVFSPLERIRRAAGGGWTSLESGEWLANAWRLVSRSPDWSELIFERVPV